MGYNDVMNSYYTFLKQKRATTGREPSPHETKAFMESALAAENERSSRERELNQRILESNTNLEMKKEDVKAQKQAAQISGVSQLASTGAQAYLTYKLLKKPDFGGNSTSTPPPSPGTFPKGYNYDIGEQPTSGGMNSWAPNPTSSTGVTNALNTGYNAGSLTSSVGTLSTPSSAASAPSLTIPGMTSAPTSTPYSLETGKLLPTYSPVELGSEVGGSAGFSGGTSATGTYTGAEYGTYGTEAGTTTAGSGGGVAGPLVAGAVALGTGIEGMRKAQGQSWGEANTLEEKANKGATQLTPWNDESTAGKVMNALPPFNMLSSTVGAFQMVTGVVKSITGGSIICTELCEQGYISKNIVDLDGQHRVQYIDDATYRGYVMWAKYVVKLMKRSKTFTWIIAPLGKAWAYEMASRMDSSIKGSLLGKIEMMIGAPICKWLGGK